MKKLILIGTLIAAAACGQNGAPARRITFNGSPLTDGQLRLLNNLERLYGVRLPEAAFWYDKRSGAMGFWNGPAAAVLPPALDLGGAMPADCSGGATNVFVNGRALHPLDIAALSRLGPVFPGRYWLDANGNFGYEGGPPVGNLVAAIQASRGASGGQHRVYSPGELSGVIVNSAGACTSSGCVYRQ